MKMAVRKTAIFFSDPLRLTFQVSLHPMKNILIPVDLKAETGHVLDQARSLAQATNAKLWVLHVAAPEPDFVGYEPGPQYIRDIRADTLREERGELQQITSELTSIGIASQQLLVMGPTVETILGEAERLDVDLIIMGTHGRRGLAKAFMGSTCDDVLRANRFKVLVVPTPVHDQ